VQEQEPLIESMDRDTEGVMHRMQAATHRLQEVLKKMNFCTQLGIIMVLVIVLIFMLWFTFS
jgi:DNA-binding protein YbaB